MKKLFLISEVEKNRILNIHSNAVKKQYLSEANETPEEKIANEFYGKGAKGMGTNPEIMINAINSITSADQFWKVNELVKKKSGKLDIAGVINDEFEYPDNKYSSNKSDLDKIIYKLKSLGIGSTIRKENGGYISGTFEISPQSETTQTKNVDNKKNTENLQKRRTEIINKTTENTKQIQKLLGVPETGQMDTGLLNLINTKLKGETQQPRQKLEPINLKPAGVVSNTAKPTANTNIPKPAQTK